MTKHLARFLRSVGLGVLVDVLAIGRDLDIHGHLLGEPGDTAN